MQKPSIIIFILNLLFVSSIHAVQTNPLQLSAGGGPKGSFRKETSFYEVRTPAKLVATPASAMTAEPMVLEFEFFCVGGTPSITFQSDPPVNGKRAEVLPGLYNSETWSPYRARLGSLLGVKRLLLDFGLAEGRVLQLRDLTLRREVPGEFDKVAKVLRSAPAELIDAELTRVYPASVTDVALTKDKIIIKGMASGVDGPLEIAETLMEKLVTDPDPYIFRQPVTLASDESFEVSLPRVIKREGLDHDWMLSRWSLVSGDSTVRVSHFRYATEIACIDNPPPLEEIAHKKGISGYRHGSIPTELKELGISAMTINVMMDSFLSTTGGEQTIAYQWQGKPYYAKTESLDKVEASLLEATANHVVVSAILLVENPAQSKGGSKKSLLAHPDAQPAGRFVMPDVTSSESINAYAGLLNFLAQRWSRADGKYGRVHHWIVHNEVDAGWVWTNAGEIAAAPFMDLYQRSLRLTDLIVRQYDPNAHALISLTHYWTEAGNPRFYGSKEMFRQLLRFTAAEGDFPWAVAFHPYPENLRMPRTWEDKSATDSFDTEKITPYNIEVLDAWMHRPEMLYQGNIRPVQLSENGFNSPKNTPQALEEQTAAMAYVWKKIAPLDSIKVWHYHNWYDSAGEGGLLLGLRTFKSDGGKPKPIWYLYRDLGTAKEDAACAPYLKTIGIKSWDEVPTRSILK